MRERARVPAVQLAAGRACPQPRLKNKGAGATFQWKISGDDPDAPRDRYLAPMINHRRQRKALQEPLRDRGDEAAGRNRVLGTPPHPKPLFPPPLLYFRLFGGGGGVFPPSFSQLAHWVCFLCFTLQRHRTALSSVSRSCDPGSPSGSTATARGR